MNPALHKRTAGQIVVEALTAEQVEIAFGLVGSHILGIYEALRSADHIVQVTVKHETNAGFMADAYAKLSGKTAVILTTAGPGVLNLMGGIGQAYFQASPMVIISGGVPTHALREDVHGGDSPQFTRDAMSQVTKAAFRVTVLDDLPSTLANAFQLARSGRPGPTYVEVPWNLVTAPPAAAAPYHRLDTLLLPACPTGLLRTIEDRVANSHRPVICIDKGVVRTGLASRVVRLAERIGALLVVSYDAIGAVPGDHPLYAGVANDFFFGDAAFEALKSSDFALGLGLRPATGNEDFFYRLAGGESYSVYLDDRPGVSPKGITYSLESVVAHLEARLAPNDGWNSRAPGRTAADSRRSAEAYARTRSDDSPLHPGYVVAEVARHVTDDMTICLDVGANEVWSHSILPVAGTHSQLGAANWAGMGLAMPALIGARYARPAAPRLGITGDGGLLMCSGDYPTLLQAGGPCVLIVLNDSSFGIIDRFQTDAFGAGHATSLGRTNFAEIARGFGGRALRVESGPSLGPALEAAFAAREPILIDAVTAGGVEFPPCLRSPQFTG